MANPIVPQGTLNRLRGSVTIPSNTGLNITASYLGKDGISMSFDGAANTAIDTMTGIVQSPEPYQRVTVAIHLLKSQARGASLYQRFGGGGPAMMPSDPTGGSY